MNLKTDSSVHSYAGTNEGVSVSELRLSEKNIPKHFRRRLSEATSLKAKLSDGTLQDQNVGYQIIKL